MSASPTNRFDSFVDLARARRSVRRLQPEPVPFRLIERVLEAATLAPSPHNAQPWRFVVVLDPARKRRLADAMLSQWHEDLRRDGLDDAAIRARTRRPYDRTVDAPVAILACLVREGLDEYPDLVRQAAEYAMAIQSIGAAVQNLLLAATDAGLATSWICAPLFCGAVIRKALDLPADWDPQALVLTGYPGAEPAARPRRPVHEVTLWR